MPRFLALQLLLVTVSLLLHNCASPSKSSQPSGKEVPEWTEQPIPLAGQELSAYQEILGLYKNNAYDAALNRLRDFYRLYPGSGRLAQIQNLHGLIHLQKKDYDKATFRFNEALKVDTSPFIRQFVLYNLATAYYGLKKFSQTESTLAEIKADLLTRGTRTKYYYMQGLMQLRRKNNMEALEMFLIGSAQVPRHERSPLEADLLKFEDKVNQLIRPISDVSLLGDIYRRNENSALAGLLAYKLGEVHAAQGNNSSAEAFYKKVISDYPESSRFADAMDKLRNLSQQRVVDPKAVGVLLPLSGTDAKFARKALRGVELAFRIFNSNEPSSNVTLIVEDSGSTAEEAVQALEKLYYDNHVVAVIGPLHSKTAEAVTQKAQDLGLPLMSLAQKEGVSGDYIFQSAVSLKIQCYEIARHAIKVEGLKKFAVIYPQNNFGKLQMEYFWNAVEEMGGEIVAAEHYPPGTTDVNQEVKKIVGLHYLSARQRELDALAALRRRDNIKKQSRATESYYKLEPIINFDAVFIPDDAKTVTQVMPTFAFFDVDHVKFLGTATWNSPIFLQRAGDSGTQSLFTSAFFSESQSSETRSFVSRFYRVYGERPELLEAMAFDAASLLENVLLLSNDGLNRREIRDRLTEIQNFPGVTGQISFKEGQLLRNLKILTVERKQFKEVL